MSGHVHQLAGGERVKAVTITLEAREVMELEAVLLDRDANAALRFLKEVIRAKIRSQGSGELDAKQGTGIPT